MLHVVITLELDLDTSVAIVKNKAYVKNIEEEILTQMMCLGESGSEIKIGSIQDLYGQTCSERKFQETRSLQTSLETL